MDDFLQISRSATSTPQPEEIPVSLQNEELVFLKEDATAKEIEDAVNVCKEMVLEYQEFSAERSFLVRHLVDLRLRLAELLDSEAEHTKSNSKKLQTKVFQGHTFVLRTETISTKKVYCDQCSYLIYQLFQHSYSCKDCSFSVHYKCLSNVRRICVSILVAEKMHHPNENICPEVGLSYQNYKCGECSTPLINKTTYNEPRLCDYSGLYYCKKCHWGDYSIIPARIVLNWDFQERKVSRIALQEINFIYERPVINLEERNPKLFVFVGKLTIIKKIRENLLFMKKYLDECRFAKEKNVLETAVSGRCYLVESVKLYSLYDLVCVENNSLLDKLNNVFQIFYDHILNCEICRGKGYLCEICGNNEIIFPFYDATVYCHLCNSCNHRLCIVRKNMTCPKCVRLKKIKAAN